MATKTFFVCILFLFGFSFLIAELTGSTTSLFSPLTLGITGSLLAIVIGLSNTPVLKGGAMLLLFLDIALHFVFSSVDPIILAVIVAPVLLTLGLAMAEIGQG